MTAINLRSYARGLNDGTLKPSINLKNATVNGLPLFLDTKLPFTIRNVGLIWAPRGDKDNDPTGWSQNVAALSGLGIDQVLDPNDEETLFRFIKAMNRQEKGSYTVSDEDLRRGVRMGLNYKTDRNLPIPEKTKDKRQQEIRDNVSNAIEEFNMSPEDTQRFKDIAKKKLDIEFGANGTSRNR
jgi:hypothetical protein